MGLPRELSQAVRRLDEAELRRLMILCRGLLLRSPGPVLELDDVPGMPTVTYRQEHVRCGRGCDGCPHGPYWYAYWREGARQRSLYIGRDLPADVRQRLDARDADSQARGGTGAGDSDAEDAHG